MKKKTPKNPFVSGPISPEKIAKSIANHSHKTNIGGHSIFLGQVRADIQSEQEVQAIEYTAYEELAIQKIHEIREQAFEKFDLECLHIYHSLGSVEQGAICLFVFTSSKHRKAAIDSCAWLVEQIKNEVPIWGKELFEGDKHQWKENK